ncbi:unnamed protein product [Microthlaspi erraticum]|uniref:DUF4283 domain-containing protein n=1 Tax=Microthlaspi erraticum TaxID=1685480 RepID=A0A6D2L2X0_9BRAS|nr:unnamed protein product [Microthlaspi erraticum]
MNVKRHHLFSRGLSYRPLEARHRIVSTPTTLFTVYTLSPNVARRFTYAEKGKGVAGPEPAPLGIRIRAPHLDTSELVKKNALTLIGRLINPQKQRLRSMLSYFSNKWELRGLARGSNLEHDCFQFRFDYEDDLKKVLDNRPYQYSRWMVILQRWEPIISPSFPSKIPF